MNKKASRPQDNGYYVRLMNILRDSPAYVPLIMIPFGLLVRSGLMINDYYLGDFMFASIASAHVALSAFYFYANWRWPKHILRFPFMVAFHAITILFVVFVGGFLNAFLSIWILLMLSADMLYGRIGFLISFASLGLAGLLSMIIHPVMPINNHFEVLQCLLVFGLLGYVIARIRSASDRERAILAKTREEQDFERERLLALVNSMGDAVVTTNDAGNIKVYNAALLDLLDTNANLAGKQLDKILRLKDQSGARINITDDARSIRKLFSRTDLSYYFSDDEAMRLYINVAPINPGYQSHAERGFIFIIRDITKEKTLEEERDEFISVVSHELRTPIAIAEGNLSNILVLQQRGAAPEVLQRAASDAHEQIMYLAKMINDLATLSRAERSINTDGTEQINPKDLLVELYKTYLPQATEKKLHLNLDVAPQLPAIRTSRLYIEEILQNFVTNAIKYTKEGSVTIIGHTIKEGVYIGVKDTGIGISKSDQRHIFEKFYRSEDYRTRESKGTGLGLYITKKLADKMNLHLKFESRINHGSTFSIIIKPDTADALAVPATKNTPS